MKKVRLGIIGLGNIGSQHYVNVLSGKCPEIDVVAVADINPDRLEWAEKTNKVYQEKNPCVPTLKKFFDASEMMKSGLVDAVIVSVPHYDHPRYAIEAFRCGLHVMCEKPSIYLAGKRNDSRG